MNHPRSLHRFNLHAFYSDFNVLHTPDWFGKKIFTFSVYIPLEICDVQFPVNTLIHAPEAQI